MGSYLWKNIFNRSHPNDASISLNKKGVVDLRFVIPVIVIMYLTFIGKPKIKNVAFFISELPLFPKERPTPSILKFNIYWQYGGIEHTERNEGVCDLYGEM